MRYLVVVPDGNPVYPIWCIEFAINLKSQGHEVFFLNLQCYNTHNSKSFLRRFISSVTRKNRSSLVITKLCLKHKISYIRPRKSSMRHKEILLQLNSEAKRVFKMAISSKYGASLGKSDIQEHEVSINIINLEREFFLRSYYEVVNIILSLKIDEVITVNGRLVVSSAIVYAGRSLNKKISLIETVDSLGTRYDVFDKSPHDLHESEQKRIQLWNTSGASKYSECEVYMQDFLSKRIKSAESSFGAFSGVYDETTRPSKMLTVFTTSEIELPTFRDFYVSSTFGGSQLQAIRALAPIAKANGYKIVVRVHPQNSKARQLIKEENFRWKNLCEEIQADCIFADNMMDSYDLIRRSDLVVTYTSSIGIDSILLGKPLMVLGETDYSCFIPENLGYTEAEIERLFTDRITSVPSERIFPWIYYHFKGGQTLKYFKISSLGQVMYNEKILDGDNLLGRIAKKFLLSKYYFFRIMKHI